MTTNPTSAATYNDHIRKLNSQVQTLKKKRSRIAWGRFLSLLAVVLSLYFLRPFGWTITIVSTLVFISTFLRLLVLSANNNDRIANLERLIEVNKMELLIGEGKFTDLPDGTPWLPPTHDYANDLDIFGRGSLFQYLNRTRSEQGNETFSHWLLNPASSTEINARQDAAKELSGKLEWRQQLQAYGLENRITVSAERKILNWLVTANSFLSKGWHGARLILPAIMLTALVLHIAGWLAAPWFYMLVFISFITAGVISRKVMPVWLQLDKVVKEISTLSHIITWIENETFHAPMLLQLQKDFLTENVKASSAVKQLRQILDRMDYRLNPLVFFVLNTFLYWDLQQVMALEHWKERNGSHIKKWFENLGVFESLSTVAGIHFNHPDWAFPSVEQGEGIFVANDIGHPLISESKRVTSSFATRGKGKLALVTGSNMAGKSTFLRCIGVNIVLGMMGAPVCARSLSLSEMKVISSMRVTDNLQESTSTFYAELKKLKLIIEAVNRGEKVFLLLDEILRGTNSLDRYTGSKALIKQLIAHQAVGMLATHDLELAKLEADYSTSIHNYHFDVQVAGEELYFDYQLKEGVCQSLNASILMKKIGIEL